MDKRQELRDKLNAFGIHIPYDKGKDIRKQLNELALKHYKPKHSSDDYLTFMNKHDCTFKQVEPQSVNFPYFLCLFTVLSQHVYGDIVEECLDKAMDYLPNGKPMLSDDFKKGITNVVNNLAKDKDRAMAKRFNEVYKNTRRQTNVDKTKQAM